VRVCLFVLNNCTVDSRVLRQGQTFANAGHETIIMATRRGDVSEVEHRDGFEIRRVPVTWTWCDGYPRLAKVLPLARMDARRARHAAATAAAMEAKRAQEAAELATQHGIGAAEKFVEEFEPGGEELPSAESPDPQTRAPITIRQWRTWLFTGKGPAPRSWRHETQPNLSRRIAFAIGLVLGSPAWAARLIWRKARRVILVIPRRIKRQRARMRRFVARYLLLPTRYRQLDRRMAREAIKFNADLYWANDTTTVRSAYAAARATGARFVYDAHEVIWDAPTVKPLHRRLLGWTERAHVRKAHQVFTVCDPISNEMAARYRIKPPTVVLNCPRLAETSVAVSPQQSPLNAYRNHGERIVLFHGSLSPWRGLEQLVQAMSHLPSEYRLIVLGHGVFRETLERIADEENVAHRVTFLQSVPPNELPAWLAGADVGMIPYQRHGRNHEYSTPNKLFEYMHLGIPIIANDLPEIRRIVTEVGFGVIADCSDPVAIAKAVADLLSDPQRCATMREHARAAAVRYSWESQEPLILSALPNQSAPPVKSALPKSDELPRR
jgi:glycosyltransferase involved in cell wall biosynthesis